MKDFETPDFDGENGREADRMESIARQIMAIHGVTGGVQLSRPDDEDDEPAFLPEDMLRPVVSAWLKRNVPNN